MKRGNKTTISLNIRWLAIVPVAAILVFIIPSCKEKTVKGKISSGQVTAVIGGRDSVVMRAEEYPSDAPPPPPPPPPLPYNVNNGDTIWYRVDQLPQFPGGIEAMNSFIGSNIVYPESAIKKKLQGRVVAGFVLTNECKIVDATIVTGFNPECDKEALRVINSLPEFEKPAYVKGRPVNYHFTVPIHFALK